MSTFFFHDANFLFSTAIGIVILFFIFECLGMVMGVSPLGLFDDLPDVDPGADNLPAFSSVVHWLSLDRLPLMIWLILLLTLFGLSGYLLNVVYSSYSNGQLISAYIGAPIAFLIALLLTARSGSALARLLPKSESSALGNEAFVGLVGEITLGVARTGSAAEAKCSDKYSQAHYVLVEPFEADETFIKGDKIILVKKTPQGWLATRYR